MPGLQSHKQARGALLCQTLSKNEVFTGKGSAEQERMSWSRL